LSIATICSIVTFISTIWTFLRPIGNWVIHFIMNTVCSWSSSFASSHVWIRYHILNPCKETNSLGFELDGIEFHRPLKCCWGCKGEKRMWVTVDEEMNKQLWHVDKETSGLETVCNYTTIYLIWLCMTKVSNEVGEWVFPWLQTMSSVCHSAAQCT